MNDVNPNASASGNPAGQDVQRVLERLIQENSELKSQLRHVLITGAVVDQHLFRLINGHTHLDLRLQRVEDSVVFRFLKWLGARLTSLGFSFERGIPTFKGSSYPVTAGQRYSDWVQEAAIHHLVREVDQPRPGKVPSPTDRLRISVLLDAWHADRAQLERMLASLEAQRYSDWNLWACAAPDEREWLGSTLVQTLSGRSFEIITGPSLRDSFRCALDRCDGAGVVFAGSGVILEPDALERWVAALSLDAVAAYSDWDFIDTGGNRHTPRFTPELSPELLSQTLYWGRCFVARTAQVLETGWPGESEDLPLFHDLALRLAQRPGTIPRVAKMLWHMQDGPSSADAAADAASAKVKTSLITTPPPEVLQSVNGSTAHSGHAGNRASVIICSRKAEQLHKCLKAVMPTLGHEDEVIVIAHQAGDSAALDQVAKSHHARLIPYQGAFHFGMMNDLGVRASEAPVLCFLNDDVYPVAADWLDSMRAQAIRPDVGIVGALLLYPDQTIQHAGIAVGGWFFPTHIGRTRKESPYWPWLRMTREVAAVTGACMVLRRSVWDELGGFYPRFPVNYNDVDLCLQAGDRGYRVLVETRAVLIHEDSKTRVPVVRPEESALFYERWGAVISAPDKFFNPQLGHLIDSIELPNPWTVVR